MGHVMGCGLCPYNAIEKVGNYVLVCMILNGFINDWSRKVDETKIIVIKK